MGAADAPAIEGGPTQSDVVSTGAAAAAAAAPAASLGVSTSPLAAPNPGSSTGSRSVAVSRGVRMVEINKK